MATTLRNFLDQLTTDSELMEQFEADQTGVMTAYGVSPEDQDLIMSEDADREERLAAAVGKEHAKHQEYEEGNFSRFFL
jgi:hypothetical protein